MDDQKVSFPYTTTSVKRNVSLNKRTMLIIAVFLNIVCLAVLLLTFVPSLEFIFGGQVEGKISYSMIVGLVLIASLIGTYLVLINKTKYLSYIIGFVLHIEVFWQLSNDLKDDITVASSLLIILIGYTLFSRKLTMLFGVTITIAGILGSFFSGQPTGVIVEYIINSVLINAIGLGLIWTRFGALDRAKKELLETNKEMDGYKVKVNSLNSELEETREILNKHPELLKESIG